MKLSPVLILGCVLALIPAWLGGATQAHEVIEHLPYGHINWTRGVLVVRGCDGQPVDFSESEIKTSPPTQTPAQNLLDSLTHVRMDAQHSVTDMMALNPGLQNKILQMVAAAPIINQVRTADGRTETAVQFQLTGGFAQLMLPGSIEQVRSIKPINGGGGTESEIDPPRGMDSSASRDIYTGLIIDARGIGAKPCLVPMIVDEKHQDVYSPAFVSREFAVRQGVCGYARQVSDEVTPRVGPKPLLLKGLRTVNERPSDIVISDADASRVRGASPHLRFLRQCRVVIILD